MITRLAKWWLRRQGLAAYPAGHNVIWDGHWIIEDDTPPILGVEQYGGRITVSECDPMRYEKTVRPRERTDGPMNKSGPEGQPSP